MMGHDELAISLAAHLRTDDRMTWCDMQLGSSNSPRPDVYTIFKSYVRPNPTAYEVKVSRSDFRADVTAGKWQSYLKFACGVYFACEGDLISKSDVPEHCGLIVFKSAWRVAKKAVLSPIEIPHDAWLKLLIDGVQREGPRARGRLMADYNRSGKFLAKYGEVASKVVRDRMAVEMETEQAHYSADRIVQHANERAAEIIEEAKNIVAPARVELCEILGLKPTANRYDIKVTMDDIRRENRRNPAVERLQHLTAGIQSQLRAYGFQEDSHDKEGD